MPIDPKTLDEARTLVAEAGMTNFSPGMAYTTTHGTLIPIFLIDPMVRAPGVPNFNKEDPERPGVVRTASILRAFRDNTPVPPLVVFQRTGEARYELREGFHRFHLSAALGFTHVPAEITNWKPGEY